jgi:hypothetical protein
MLMQALMKATPDDAALLILGDIDQLPSVGPRQVLPDIIGSGAVRVVRLTEVFPQAAASRIIINAHRINQGLTPDLSAPSGDNDFCYSRRGSRDRGSAYRGVGEDSHPQTLRIEPDPRHPGALPDEPRRRWFALAQHRIAGAWRPAAVAYWPGGDRPRKIDLPTKVLTLVMNRRCVAWKARGLSVGSSSRGRPMRIELAKTVAAPSTGAFAVVADVFRWPQLIPSVRSVEVLMPGPIRPREMRVDTCCSIATARISTKSRRSHRRIDCASSPSIRTCPMNSIT